MLGFNWLSYKCIDGNVCMNQGIYIASKDWCESINIISHYAF